MHLREASWFAPERIAAGKPGQRGALCPHPPARRGGTLLPRGRGIRLAHYDRRARYTALVRANRQAGCPEEEAFMLSVEENALLTDISPGTPMGNLMRRYWVPVMLSGELPQPDGDPMRVRLLCEDLVIFRDTLGRGGPAAGTLPAPPRVALPGTERGGRPALHLPRLEVRRHGPLRRHAETSRPRVPSRRRSGRPATHAGRRRA